MHILVAHIHKEGIDGHIEYRCIDTFKDVGDAVSTREMLSFLQPPDMKRLFIVDTEHRYLMMVYDENQYVGCAPYPTSSPPGWLSYDEIYIDIDPPTTSDEMLMSMFTHYNINTGTYGYLLDTMYGESLMAIF
jgi:hypothetical protein